jgi:alpha-N-arabinofuranosidase
MNHIKVDLDRRVGSINRYIFGSFAEHLGRCIYGGIYEPGSALSDEDGLRTDVLNAICQLRIPIIRYPGGNFVSGYRWMDGIGPIDERPSRAELAWNTVESNRFGTNEFVNFCRKVNAEPYLVVNCGDGDMREAGDWVEYCNGTHPSSLVKLRHKHGYEQPHQVKYWGIGNEVDGAWQIGYKTPEEYARAYLEFAKVMRWIDPSIKLIASATSDWKQPIVERTQLLLEQADKYIDYISIHWYVGNKTHDFATYMATAEVVEERISAFEGLIKALQFQQKSPHPIHLAVDEWNVWYRTHPDGGGPLNKLEEVYNLEDALAVAMQLNAFIRHAQTVKMANIAQIVNVIAPIFTRPEGLLLQTIFYPFEVYSRTCGDTALDVSWTGETFSTPDRNGLRVLDVSATLSEEQRYVTVFAVNRSQSEPMETTISLDGGNFAGQVQAFVVNGPDIKAENTFDNPFQVRTSEAALTTAGGSFHYTFEPHSVTALVFAL